jgi:SAM-dependent methyltransferase
MGKLSSNMVAPPDGGMAGARIQGAANDGSVRDPEPENWADVSLPDAWADEDSHRGLRGALRIIRRVFGKRGKVQLPEGVPGVERIPRYALLEFHHLPNGNYSKRLTRGYIRGFEASMLGEMKRVRRQMATDLSDARSVLDVGCGGARMAGHLMGEGREDVWGIDPSPYMLNAASENWPELNLKQGVMEALPFPDQRFDGVSVIFVFHEMPPPYARQGLAEIARVLRPGGRLVVAEPSPTHYDASFLESLRRFGWRGGYFNVLAHLVHEPFVRAWHGMDFPHEADKQGLTVVSQKEGMPIKYWLLEKRR